MEFDRFASCTSPYAITPLQPRRFASRRVVQVIQFRDEMYRLIVQVIQFLVPEYVARVFYGEPFIHAVYVMHRSLGAQ